VQYKAPLAELLLADHRFYSRSMLDNPLDELLAVNSPDIPRVNILPLFPRTVSGV
jgi:hypothetical protein